MPRFMLELPRDAIERLQDLARSQRRTPKEQAEWLLLEALEAWSREDETPRGTLGAGKGSAFPERIFDEASLTNELPAMGAVITKHLLPE